MSLEFIGGALFTMLYDGVKQAVSQNSTFKSLLGDLKSTLDSLVPRDIQQIGEHNLELGLPNEEIESLQVQMEEGVKLVRKFSEFRLWNYCCVRDYSDQIVELDRALRRLLERLRMQEARDVKEVLALSRQNRDKLDEVNRRLLDVQMLLQQRQGGDTTAENLGSESNAETAPEQLQGNGSVEQVTSFDGGASLEAWFDVLFDVVLEVKDKTVMYKPLLRNLESTLDSLEPLIEELGKHNKVLERPKDELEDIRIQIEKGIELIERCSKVRLWDKCKQYKYANRILGLDESLQRLLNTLKVQVARDVKEISASIKNLETVIKQIEGSGVVQDLIQTKGPGALPKPVLSAVGMDILNVQETRDPKDTSVSFRNTKAVVEKPEVSGSGMVRNQSKSESWTESHSRSTFTNPSTSTESQYTEAEIPRMDKPQTDENILETSNLRVFSFAELKAATDNFRTDFIIGEGSFGQVFKGRVDMNTLAPSKVAPGRAIVIKKISPDTPQGPREWQSVVKFLGKHFHPNLVKLWGYCWEERQGLFLVHEYMARGSLETHLFRSSTTPGIEPLTWHSRLKITIGAARGLAFLHTSAERAMFRDFKTSNILLGRDFNAKISNYGLPLLVPTGGESPIHCRILGTYSYAAPEYIKNGHLYMKSDVYGFGVVLLELLTGLRALDRNRLKGQQNLVEWAKPLLLHERKLMRIIDARMEGQYSIKAALQVAQITQKCLAPDPRSRPSMEEVQNALEEIQTIEENNVGKN